MSVGNITIGIAGHAHGESGGIEDQQVFQLAGQGYGAAGGSEGFLLVTPSAVGVSLSNRLGHYADAGAVIAEGSFEGNFGDQGVSIIEGFSASCRSII